MLLRRLRRVSVLVLFDVRRHSDRIDLSERDVAEVAPVHEITYRPCVGLTRIPVPDRLDEEPHEAIGRLLAGGRDHSRDTADDRRNLTRKPDDVLITTGQFRRAEDG